LSKSFESLDTGLAEPMTIGQLWREFLPLSLSDVTMALGDPLMTTTLAHLPNARMNIAAVGIARSLAIFFESPIIMILHASNALAPTQASRRALWRFVLLAGGGLSALLMLVALPIVFNLVGDRWFGIPLLLSPTVQRVLMLMGLWPFAIAWRRYFQGLLIHHGHSKAVAKASLFRLATVAGILGLGFQLKMSGATIAGLSLVLGVIVEAIVVTIAAKRRSDVMAIPTTIPTKPLPKNIPQVWRFYWPLANSMMVAWGGRTLLVGVIARSVDAPLALAAWPAAWGLVLVIANSTRMVQQIIIKYRHRVTDARLLNFALTVGASCSLLLLFMSTTPIGTQIIQSFIGSDRDLADRIRPVLLICTLNPLLVAVLNAVQGFMVSEGRTGSVNLATWLGTTALLGVAIVMVHRGWDGAIAAAVAMLTAMLVEIGCLIWQRRSGNANTQSINP
jgi:progressive ankylosis protein